MTTAFDIVSERPNLPCPPMLAWPTASFVSPSDRSRRSTLESSGGGSSSCCCGRGRDFWGDVAACRGHATSHDEGDSDGGPKFTGVHPGKGDRLCQEETETSPTFPRRTLVFRIHCLS